MPTPVELKCYQCVFFTEIKLVSEEEGFFKYLCLAYPEGIPEDIRCWEAEDPSAIPRPHISIQEDQVGEFVFEEKLPDRKINLTVDNILDYQLYDTRGIIGPFATTAELELFRKYLLSIDKYPALKDFIKRGASMVTQELVEDIFKIKNVDNNKIIIALQSLIEQAETVVIISTED